MSSKINEENLCVLKKTANSEVINLHYEQVLNPLEDYLVDLYAMFNDDSKTGDMIFKFIKNHSVLNVLFKYFNFCGYLSNSYEGIYDSIEEIERKFNSSSYSKEDLLKLCKKRVLAYSLDKTYEKCINDPDVLTYSHRRIGFSSPQFILNSNFSIQFLTNFGYGWASYFFTKLKYKEIDIIPFSKWIEYRNAELTELIRYSHKPEPYLQNESWEDAMKYGRDACNVFLHNEEEFVAKYLRNECEKLINGLNRISRNSKFRFTKMRFISIYQSRYEDIEFTGYKLIEFRGEKISGALTFIGSIKDLGEVISIKSYISEIECHNKSIQPSLTRQLGLIESDLKSLNIKFEAAKNLFEELKKKDEDYSNKRKEYKEELTKEEKYNFGNFDEMFEAKYSDYKSFKTKYNDASSVYYKLSSEISDLENVKDNIVKYDKTISDYFSEKETLIVS